MVAQATHRPSRCQRVGGGRRVHCRGGRDRGQIGGTDAAAQANWWADYAEHVSLLAVAALIASSGRPGWRILAGLAAAAWMYLGIVAAVSPPASHGQLGRRGRALGIAVGLVLGSAAAIGDAARPHRREGRASRRRVIGQRAPSLRGFSGPPGISHSPTLPPVARTRGDANTPRHHLTELRPHLVAARYLRRVTVQATVEERPNRAWLESITLNGNTFWVLAMADLSVASWTSTTGSGSRSRFGSAGSRLRRHIGSTENLRGEPSRGRPRQHRHRRGTARAPG